MDVHFVVSVDVRSRLACRSSLRRPRHGISMRNCWLLRAFPKSSIIRWRPQNWPARCHVALPSR